MKVLAVHSFSYHKPITDAAGKVLKKKIMFQGVEQEFDAVETVYGHEGVHDLPDDIAKGLIASGAVKRLTKEVAVEDEPAAEPPVDQVPKGKGGKAADLDPMLT